MGSWYLSITVSLVLIFIGLTTHWIVMLIGALMLFIPPLSMLIQHRRERLGRERVADDDRQENSKHDQ